MNEMTDEELRKDAWDLERVLRYGIGIMLLASLVLYIIASIIGAFHA